MPYAARWMRHHRGIIVGIALVTLLAAVSGCTSRARHRPNLSGGHTLETEAKTMEEAIPRFRRSAEELCGAAYSMTPPVATKGKWRFTTEGFRADGSAVTLRSELTCR